MVLLGQGTKLSPYLMDREKVYTGVLRLGVETDTLDPTGNVVNTAAVPDFSLETVQEAAQRFVGEIEQQPPAYSALKHEGKPAYALARAGRNVHLEKRPVRVSELRVLSVASDRVRIRVRCGKGTYIRSLAADLGRALGTGAHLCELRRVSIGPFSVADAWRSDATGTEECAETIRARLIPLDQAIPWMPEIAVDEGLAQKIRNGRRPSRAELNCDMMVPESSSETATRPTLMKLTRNGRLVAIIVVHSTPAAVSDIWLDRVFS
jgi:tRNA pseudouridine55 synthase